ncbi:hypothetical protein [Cryptosporangium japonicum]|uniref:Tight adherence protein B n=1 Tax=Cryptosporangium japonicum TaxID=80872 RepID=A0ABP3EI87_9ACTN
MVTGVVPVVAALALLGAAAMVAVPGSARGRLRVVARSAGAASGPGPGARLLGAGRRRALPRRRLVVPLLALAALLTAVVVGPVVAGAALAYGLAGRRALGQRAATRAADELRALGGVALAGLADDLRAGRTPSAALHAAIVTVEDGPVTAPVASALAAARVAVVRHPFGDVAALLRAVPGPLEPAFGRLAAAWTLADCGIPLADVVGQLDVELRRLRRLSERAAVHTASARTTARLVAGLPVLGLGIGQLLGAAPLAVLTRTPGGAACAAAAVALHLIGFSLARRLSRVVLT